MASDHTPCSRARAPTLSCQEFRLGWWFSTGVTLHPRIFGNVWRHSWSSQLAKRMLLASSEEARDVAQHPAVYNTVPPTKAYLAPNVKSSETENPTLRDSPIPHKALYSCLFTHSHLLLDILSSSSLVPAPNKVLGVE